MCPQNVPPSQQQPTTVATRFTDSKRLVPLVLKLQGAGGVHRDRMRSESQLWVWRRLMHPTPDCTPSMLAACLPVTARLPICLNTPPPSPAPGAALPRLGPAMHAAAG